MVGRFFKMAAIWLKSLTFDVGSCRIKEFFGVISYLLDLLELFDENQVRIQKSI